MTVLRVRRLHQVQPYSEGGDLIRPFAPALQDGASLAHGI